MTTITITLSDDEHRNLADVASAQGVTVEQLATRILEEKARSLGQEDDLDVRSMYPLMAKVFGPAGWDDPAMDIYNALDPLKFVQSSAR